MNFVGAVTRRAANSMTVTAIVAANALDALLGAVPNCCARIRGLLRGELPLGGSTFFVRTSDRPTSEEWSHVGKRECMFANQRG